MAVPIAALAALGQAAYQYSQAEKQNKLAKKVKPSNYIPPSVSEATASARMEANASIGPATKRGLEKLGLATAGTIENAKRLGGTPAQIQQTVADADTREKEVIKDLAVNDSAWKSARRDELNYNLQTQGQYEKMSRDSYNAAKSALTGASMQNKYNAISSAAEGIIWSLGDDAISPSEGSGAGRSAPAARAVADSTPAAREITTTTGEGLSKDIVGKFRRMYGGKYPASIGVKPFDHRKYLADMNMKRFSTGY